ncbi:MAG: hypothetical protein PHQ88_02040 [Bacteroides sp.]|nr:hypothetical protein [Bacteroides sp.]MDD2644973.1 hypothetical protein [Bacteroides sp.]MDD4054893.1 hypothetical protein [Bacteroides sp.]MDD4719628.1 hypothetical protein [Bacteroides sp.]NLI64119.1 hypothetical protein [Bacteroidales bacterium]
MKVSKKTQELLENTIHKAIDNLTANDNSSLITDIYIYVSPETGNVLLFDDNDETLSSSTFTELIPTNAVNSEFYDELDKLFAPILNKMKANNTFNELPILKPFSFVLVDENKDTYTELLLIDDDTLIISDELLKGLDEELNVFLKELLED